MYLDWESRSDKTYVIDIETDDLNASRIWVMCWENLGTGETGKCIGHSECKTFFDNCPSDSVFVGHNILKFDGPTLCRLVGARLSARNCVDTLVLSTLYSPSIVGGHSLDAWGERVGVAKGKFSDWSRLSEEMIEYCHQDVTVTVLLFRRLIKTMARIGFTEMSIWIQHHLTCVVEQQHRNGFYFDGLRALQLYTHLRSLEKELETTIRSVFRPERVLVAERPMYRKDGTPTAIYLKDQERYLVDVEDASGMYRAFEDVEFSVGSPKQRVDKLLSLGWEPREFTDAGNPRPFDKGKLSPSLEEFLETNPVPEVQLIAKWMSFNGRANMINTWLDNYNERDSCIHGKLYVADTLRFRHQAPNTANIPAVRVDKAGNVLLGDVGYFTYEARDLWTARPGRVLVGTDAAGLELRMLAHYLNRAEFTKQVIEGDPHQYNADQVGITRPQAKTLIYAIMYGAGDAKIGRTLGLPVFKRTSRGRTWEESPEGGAIKQMFLDRLGIGELMEQCKEEQKNGRIELVDGSQIVCPSPHAALNYKLQGGGARVMGLSAVLADRQVIRNGWDVLKVGDIHDEDQSDSDPECAEDFGKMRVNSITEAGERLGLNVPLSGEYKVGETWARTH